MTDLFSKFDPLIAQREALLATGVTDPYNLVSGLDPSNSTTTSQPSYSNR